MDVTCSNCGKKLDLKDSKSYLDIGKDKDPMYFCGVDCAISKLFDVVKKVRDSLLSM